MNSEFCFLLINICNNSIIDLARATIIDLCRVPVSCLEFYLCPANILYHNTHVGIRLYFIWWLLKEPFIFKLSKLSLEGRSQQCQLTSCGRHRLGNIFAS